MTIVVKERQYIYIRLAVEESGSYGHGNGGTDCSYSVYDPTGMLEGDLTISCKDTKLIEMLHALRAHHLQPSVLDRPPSTVAATTAATTAPTSVSSTYKPTAPVMVGGRRQVDVAPDVSAGNLIADLASSLGVMDPFTMSMASLVDDLLSPQGK